MLYDWISNIHFAKPWFFVLFAGLPVLIYLYLRPPFRTQGSLLVSGVKAFGNGRSWKTLLRHILFALRLLAITCIILALARPQTGSEQQLTSGEGIDIVLCLDISGSMLAQDFSPNRMEAAKQVASEFIDRRPTDRMALVIFAGESFTMCPLTTDHAVLKSQLFNVQSGLLEDGTAIGSGLATGVERLRSSVSKSKVIILLTDGENNGGLLDPNVAKELAKSFGVRVYTVGVGTEGFAPVPVQTSSGVVMQREKVSIDEKLLTQIAGETGGKYFRATDNESLGSIYKEIDRLEKSKYEVTSFTHYTEKFLPFVLGRSSSWYWSGFSGLPLLENFPDMRARVYKSTGSWYSVKTEDGNFSTARIKGIFKIDGITSTNPVAVGDWVNIEEEEGGEAGGMMITGIDTRNNYINRQSPANKHQHHIIASNLDQSLLIATLKDPKTSQGFIDRFLVAGEAFHIPSVIIFNKSDVYRKKETDLFEERKAMYETAGYKVVLMSLEKKTGMEEVEAILRGKTSLLSGHSGVGKSSFINAVVPGKELKTQDVSGWSGKGIHTTTFAEMYDLPLLSAHIIDTPGIREFGLVDIKKQELSHYFPEMRARLNDCQFNNCMHVNEPGCAIKKALNEGKLSLDRYVSYCMMLDSIEEKSY